jgi:putative sigma-54 modulation protein
VNIKISGRKVHLKESFKERVEKKLSKFDRIFGKDAEASVTVTVEKHRQTVEATITHSGMVYRAEQTDDDIIYALDEVISVLGRQIRKHKCRLEKRLRTGLTLNNNGNETVDVKENYKIVRNKRFPIKPLDVEEAILQMNMVGHQFYMFRNQDTDEINVVYHRKSGGYGLLEPDIE